MAGESIPGGRRFSLKFGSVSKPSRQSIDSFNITSVCDIDSTEGHGPQFRSTGFHPSTTNCSSSEPEIPFVDRSQPFSIFRKMSLATLPVWAATRPAGGPGSETQRRSIHPPAREGDQAACALTTRAQNMTRTCVSGKICHQPFPVQMYLQGRVTASAPGHGPGRRNKRLSAESLRPRCKAHPLRPRKRPQRSISNILCE